MTVGLYLVEVFYWRKKNMVVKLCLVELIKMLCIFNPNKKFV